MQPKFDRGRGEKEDRGGEDGEKEDRGGEDGEDDHMCLTFVYHIANLKRQ